MQPFDENHYVPIVLTKRGERRALRITPAAVKTGMRPVFLIHPVEWDYDKKAPKKTTDQHLEPLPAELVSAWGKDDAFVDLQNAGDSDVFGAHPLKWFCDEATTNGLNLTPVLSLASSNPYLNAVKTLADGGSDVCLRLSPDQWPGGLSTSIDALLNALGIGADRAHLILDLQNDVGAVTGRLARDELGVFPHLDDWRSVTVAATAIPTDMPTGPGLHTIARHDWRIYTALRGLPMPLPRVPSFGDYGINGWGTGPGINPRFMSISATLRYTLDDQWLVAKGGLWKGNGGKSLGALSVPPAARLLVSDARFMATNHCHFEPWLETVATGVGGSNAEMWRKLGTCHHLQVVTDQIANLSSTSTGP